MANQVSVPVTVIDRATAGLVRIGKAFDGAARQAQLASRAFKATGDSLQRVGRNLTAAVTLPIALLGFTSIQAAADMERMEISLASLMGSATDAKTEMAKLLEVAKLPGLGIAEAVDASIKFQSAGLAADTARESILALGNAVALAGGGKAEFNRAMLQLSQIRNKATGFGQDLRALTESLPLLGNILEEAFGTRATDQISELGFTGEEVFQKMISAMADLPKVGDSLANSMENLGDAFFLFKVNIGNTINETFNLKENFNKLGDMLRSAAEAFARLSPGIRKFIVFAALAVATLGPLLIIIGLVVSAVGSLIAGFVALPAILGAIGPFVPVFLLIAAAIVAITSAVIANREVFQEVFVRVFQRFKEIAIPSLKLFLGIWQSISPVVAFVGKIIVASIIGGIGLALKAASLLLKTMVAIGNVQVSIGQSLGLNTDKLERNLELMREIQAGVTGASADVDQVINNNQLFNPTNQVKNEINIELKQDESGKIRVAAVASNANTSTVKTFNTGSTMPVFT
jgi:tape measure domain-containing protein